MASGKALGSGLIGASILTLVHELARQVIPDAPRVDILGIRAIRAGLNAAGQTPPPSGQLYWWSLLGDLGANTLYYSLVATGRPEQALQRGALLGLGAGIATVALPPLAGLGRAPQGRTPRTQLLTVLWYLLGGLAAGASAQALAPDAVPQPGNRRRTMISYNGKSE